MKKTLLLCMLFLSLGLYTTAQCNGNLSFNSQEQVDQFIIDYPTCTSLAGLHIYVDTAITGTTIYNLDAFQNISDIGDLEIYAPEIPFGDLQNYPLSLTGLSNLTQLATLYTYAVTDFTGMENLTTVTSDIYIEIWGDSTSPTDPNFANLSQFSSLVSVHDIILQLHELPFNSINDAFPALTTMHDLYLGNTGTPISIGELSGFSAVTTCNSFYVPHYATDGPNYIGELNVLNNLEVLTGSVDISSIMSVFNSFQNLSSASNVGLDLGTNNVFLFTVSLPSLTTCRRLYVSSHQDINEYPTVFNLNLLATIGNGDESSGVYIWGNANFELDPDEVNLDVLESINGSYFIEGNNVISSNSLITISGSLSVYQTSFMSLSFLNSLQSVGGDIYITDNTQLTNCDIEVLCDKLANSPAQVTIENNATGCANASEVSLSCNENSVAGIVYADLDCDGLYNNYDVAIAHPIVLDTNGLPTGSSNGSGQYFIPLDYNSTFTFVPQTPAGLLPTSSTTITTGPTAVAVIDQNLGLCADPSVHDLAVSIYSFSPRPGFERKYWIQLTNQSGNTEAATLVFDMSNMPGASIVDAAGGVVSGNTITWDIAAITGFQSITFIVKIFVSASTPLGTTYNCNGSATMLNNTDMDLTNNSDALTQTVIGSYDPNDITVDIEAYNYDLLPANDGLELEYSIRFQNTGTAEAINVRVTDLIEQDLDISSIHMIAASHPYQLSFDANGQVEWLFENIMLPDSGANEELSHGFIHFSIKTHAGLTTQNTIDNSVAIYFDFNEPVITNTATTIFYQCPQELSIMSNSNTLCQGESTGINASEGWDNYVWLADNVQTGNANDVIVTFTEAGEFEVVVVASTTYCEATQSTLIVVNATPNTPTITQDGNTLLASGTGPFVWSLNGNILNETTSTLQITQSGNYSVMQTINGCSSDVTSGNYTYTSIDEWDIMNNITIWPNPMTDQTVMTCHLNGMTDVHMHLTDATGRIIKSHSIKTNTTTIDRNGLESGVYFITITANGSQLGASKRLVVN